MASSADLIARRLAAAGCRHAFGIPGGEVLAIMDALERAGIRVVLAKHENCAGFMGEGVHHRDLAPAILVATIGPGIANAVNVIANCFQDRVPMVALTGCVSPVRDSSSFLPPDAPAPRLWLRVSFGPRPVDGGGSQASVPAKPRSLRGPPPRESARPGPPARP